MSMLSQIKPVAVERDNEGFWAHPEFFPEDPREVIPRDEWTAWLEANQVSVNFVRLEDQVSEEVWDQYIESGYSDISFWEPEIPDDSFMLSIHDTDDGPVAIYATPITGT